MVAPQAVTRKSTEMTTEFDAIIVGAGSAVLRDPSPAQARTPCVPSARWRSQRHLVLEPLPWVSLRCRAWVLILPSRMSCSGNGSGPSATAQPEICATSTMWQTASTSGVTSSSTPGSKRQLRQRDKHWTKKTDKGGTATARFCIMATGNLSSPRTPSLRFGVLRGSGTTPVYGPIKGHFTGLRVGIRNQLFGCQSIPVSPSRRNIFMFSEPPISAYRRATRQWIRQKSDLTKHYPARRRLRLMPFSGSPGSAAASRARYNEAAATRLAK